MEFSRKEEEVVEMAIISANQEIVQLSEIQLLVVGGGVADITFS
jgi:hypothetical protein